MQSDETLKRQSRGLLTLIDGRCREEDGFNGLPFRFYFRHSAYLHMTHRRRSLHDLGGILQPGTLEQGKPHPPVVEAQRRHAPPVVAKLVSAVTNASVYYIDGEFQLWNHRNDELVQSKIDFHQFRRLLR